MVRSGQTTKNVLTLTTTVSYYVVVEPIHRSAMTLRDGDWVPPGSPHPSSIPPGYTSPRFLSLGFCDVTLKFVFVGIPTGIVRPSRCPVPTLGLWAQQTVIRQRSGTVRICPTHRVKQGKWLYSTSTGRILLHYLI